MHDPTRPAPLLGGNAGTPAGPVALDALHDRTEIACYTSPPVAEKRLLLGRATADIRVQVDGPVNAMAATLALVAPDGAATALATTVAPVTDGMCRFAFAGLCRTLLPGEALRLALQAAPCPEFLPYPALRLPDPGVAATTFTIDHAGSRLSLPQDYWERLDG